MSATHSFAWHTRLREAGSMLPAEGPLPVLSAA